MPMFNSNENCKYKFTLWIFLSSFVSLVIVYLAGEKFRLPGAILAFLVCITVVRYIVDEYGDLIFSKDYSLKDTLLSTLLKRRSKKESKREKIENLPFTPS